MLHLGRFLELCGLDVAVSGSLDVGHRLLFSTEYGFAESVRTGEERERWGTEITADTPDVVVAGEDWLLAVEAKMFHNPSAADLNAQMTRQSAVVKHWTAVLGLDETRVKHVLLLPDKLAEATSGHKWPVVTWEQVLSAYRIVGARYWANVLATALADYDALVSRGGVFGQNRDARMTGAEIVEQHAEGVLPYDSMGRSQGLDGEPMNQDISSGAWRTRMYEVKHGLPPNDN